MKILTYRKHHCYGFTLVEMAVVLVILGLMLGGLFIPLNAQMDQKSYSETQKNLSEIRESLIGFALIYRRFPCPTTTTNPTSASYGVEDSSCTSPTTEGNLPWKTLGMPEVDSWGKHWRYRVDRNFSDQAHLFALDTSLSNVDALMIQNSAGNALLTSGERPVAIVFSTGKDLVPNGENANYEVSGGLYEKDVRSPTFDDVLVFISRPLLMNRMVESGRLPQ